MNPVFRRALNVGLSANSRLASAADNAFDWLFLRETLVQSGLTSHEVILEADPMSLRYYPPPAEQFIELADNERVRVEHQRHPVPLVLVPLAAATMRAAEAAMSPISAGVSTWVLATASKAVCNRLKASPVLAAPRLTPSWPSSAALGSLALS